MVAERIFLHSHQALPAEQANIVNKVHLKLKNKISSLLLFLADVTERELNSRDNVSRTEKQQIFDKWTKIKFLKNNLEYLRSQWLTLKVAAVFPECKEKEKLANAMKSIEKHMNKLNITVINFKPSFQLPLLRNETTRVNGGNADAFFSAKQVSTAYELTNLLIDARLHKEKPTDASYISNSNTCELYDVFDNSNLPTFDLGERANSPAAGSVPNATRSSGLTAPSASHAQHYQSAEANNDWQYIKPAADNNLHLDRKSCPSLDSKLLCSSIADTVERMQREILQLSNDIRRLEIKLSEEHNSILLGPIADTELPELTKRNSHNNSEGNDRSRERERVVSLSTGSTTKKSAKMPSFQLQNRTSHQSEGNENRRRQPKLAFEDRINFHPTCDKCGDPSHGIIHCSQSTVAERKRYARKNKLCTVCLKVGHKAHDCTAPYICVKCGSRHNVRLCGRPSNARRQQKWNE